MRIATYNMRQGGSALHWAAVLGEIRPDLALIQESRDPAAFRDLLFSPPLDRIRWSPASGRRWGSAVVFPRSAVTDVEVPGYSGWVVGGEIAAGPPTSPLPLRVFSIHVPSGPGGYIRECNRILDALAGISGEAHWVLGGDFNLTASPGPSGLARRARAGESSLHRRLEAEFSVVSGWALGNPGTTLAQTLRWARDPAAPYHCDGVFIPRAWAPCLTRADVHAGGSWLERSDHNPVVLDLDFTVAH